MKKLRGKLWEVEKFVTWVARTKGVKIIVFLQSDSKGTVMEKLIFKIERSAWNSLEENEEKEAEEGRQKLLR
jgi:hypothetical protein